MPEVKASEQGLAQAADLATRLRMIRRCMGMLRHPDRHLVQEPENWELQVDDLVQGLFESSPLTPQDLENYGRAGRAELEVRQGADGRYRFAYKDDEKV